MAVVSTERSTPSVRFWERWLCNLGYHNPRKGGLMSGRVETYQYERGSESLPFIECQRCGREYIGTVTVQDSYRFPLDRPAGPWDR